MNYSKKIKIKSINSMLEHIMLNPELDRLDTIDFDNLLYKSELLCKLSHVGLNMVISEIERASNLQWKDFIGDSSFIHAIESHSHFEEEIDHTDYFQIYWTAETDSVPNAMKYITHFYKSSTQDNIEVWHAVSLWHYDNTDETYLNFSARIRSLSIKELKNAKSLRPATLDEIKELNEKWKKHQIETEKLRER
ncbi:hypothetical protein ACOMCU_00845 [Lysinibacillus sp. UGB7]|uniref:hypothetical protein n=1 Tax=Lysinibacillus sp. UGB7 TaxID=3411039 RepID=UPI003B80A8C8